MALEFNNNIVCLRIGVVSAYKIFIVYVYIVRVSMTYSFY